MSSRMNGADVFTVLASPVGDLTLVAGERGLAAILWEADRPGRVRVAPTRPDAGHPVLVETRRQLEEYFCGFRTAFDVELDLRGTDFQQRVWAALRAIPYGETRSYLAVARRLGDERAARAVGAANGRNPVSIVVPCHRVVGASGALTGFAGGLAVKSRLLDLEQRRSRFNFDD